MPHPASELNVHGSLSRSTCRFTLLGDEPDQKYAAFHIQILRKLRIKPGRSSHLAAPTAPKRHANVKSLSSKPNELLLPMPIAHNHQHKRHHTVHQPQHKQHIQIPLEMPKRIAQVPRRMIHMVQIRERAHILIEIQLREPRPRRSAPQPLHVPDAYLCERGTQAVEDAGDEGGHDGEQGPVLAAGEHGDAGRESVDAPEIEEVGDEGGGEGDARRGEQEEERGEVQVRESHARQRGGAFADIVGEAVVACGGFAPVDEFLFAEDLDAWGGGGEADGEADEEGHLWDGGVVEGGGEDFVGEVEEALEVDAVRVELGEADEEACESADAEFAEEAAF